MYANTVCSLNFSHYELQYQSLPNVPDIAPDDGSTTDEDWKFIFQNSPRAPRIPDFTGHFTPELKVYEASTSIIGI